MSSQPRPHFTLFGVPVRVELMFFVLPLFALTNRDVASALIWTALVFSGVLIHEFGHALMMRRYGFAPAITLHALGGVTTWQGGGTPRQRFFITLAGPLAGLGLGVIAVVLQRALGDVDPLVVNALEDAKFINLGWTFINLLPLLPWDGGNLVDAGLEWATGKPRHLFVGAVSLLGGIAVILFAVAARQMLLGYLGLMAVIHGWQRVSLTRSPAQQRQQQRSDYWEKLHAGDEVEEDLRFQMMTSADPVTRAKFAELLAWACLRKRDFHGARQAVKQMGQVTPSISLRARLAAAERDPDTVISLLWNVPTTADADLPLLVSALLMRDRFDDVVALGTRYPLVADVAATRLFEVEAFTHALTLCTAERVRTGLGRFAYNEACCLCRLGRLDDAVAALRQAQTLGCLELANVAKDTDLAPIAERPEVRALVN